MSVKKDVVLLNKFIENILMSKDDSLFNFFKEVHEKEGILPQEVLTPAVIERLFTDENMPDSSISHLFGMDKRKFQRIRTKHGIKINSPRHLLQTLYRAIQKDFDDLKEKIGEFKAYQLRKELDMYFDPKNEKKELSPEIKVLMEVYK